jgi:hypothetical protein
VALKHEANQLRWTRPDATTHYRDTLRGVADRLERENRIGDDKEFTMIELVGGEYDGSQFPMPTRVVDQEGELQVPLDFELKQAAFYVRHDLTGRVAEFDRVDGMRPD